MRLKGVIFDMDGTVVEAPYDWEQIRAELKTLGKPILTFIHSLKEPERSEKWRILERYENKATQNAVLKEGIHEFLDFLTKKEIKKALVTNNSQKNVSFLFNKFNLQFDYVISRERGLWKPSGAPFVMVLEKLKLKREECCAVGDSHFDIKAAEDAGISRIFILNRDKEKFSSMKVEVFHSVEDLKRRIEHLL